MIIEKYVKLELLNWQEEILYEIQGKITDSGTLTCDGNSTVRTYCSFSFLLGNLYNETTFQEISNINKKFRLFIGLSIDGEDITWYNKGILVFNNSSIVRQNAGQISVNITARDKMCLLDGTIAGKLPDPIVFHEIEERDLEGNIYYSEPTIYEIIIHLINKYGNEPYSNIIINDIPDYGRWLMEYRGATPIWLDESGGNYKIQETSPGASFTRYNAGDCIGYTLTKMTYPGELISAAGDTITSVLDKIKTVLGGNFEYYYDSDGHFIFQEKRNFINRVAIPNEIYNLTDNDYNIYTEDKEIVKSFNNNEIIISQSRTPSYSNIKNDFVVWGSKTAAGGAKIPIHYHLAIDDIPYADGQDWRDFIYDGGEDGPYGYYYKELATTYLQSDGSYISEWEKMYDTTAKEWKDLVKKNPSDLNYFLDFLDSGGAFGEYSIKKIGRRTEVLTDDEIGHIYNVTPDILFLRSSEEGVPGYTANFTMPDEFFETLTISSKGSSCYDAIRGLLYKHLLLHETISFSAVPDYSLEPNTKIEIFDKEMGIEGEYIINSISFPLNYNGLMNITANKVFKTI